MSTDLSPFNRDSTAVATTQGRGASDTVLALADWAAELDAAGRIAQILSNTEFVPQGLRGNVEATAAAILTGSELGMSPMNALANIFVVRGRPAMYARAMVALAQSHGHEVERTAATEQAVTVRARRRGSTNWTEFTWTIQRAQKAGYTSNKLYSQDPTAMLTAKAQTEACRTMFADVLSGMAATSVEEINLDGDTSAPTPAAVESKPRTVKRKTPPRSKKQPAPETPDVSETPEPEPADAPDTDADDTETSDDFVKSNRDQWQRLDAALVAQGFEDRGAKSTAVQAWVSEQGITRTVESIAGLSSDEIEAFIAELEADAQQDGDGTETLDWDTAPVGE